MASHARYTRTSHLTVLKHLSYGQSHFAASRSSREISVLLPPSPHAKARRTRSPVSGAETSEVLRLSRILKKFYRPSRNRGNLRPSLIGVVQDPPNRPGSRRRYIARKNYILSPRSQAVMSSGEVTSSSSTARVPAGSGIMRSGRAIRGNRAGRIATPLLLFCCLVAALCGVVSADEGEYVPVWSLGASGPVSSVAVTHDGSTIVASAGSMVYLLDRQGNVLWQNSAGSRVNGVGISPEGSWIGVAADKLYLYNRDGDLLWTVKTSFVYRSVDLSSNGMYVAAGCDNGAVYIFDRNKKQLWDYDMGTDSYGLAISENGRRIAIGCDNQGVYLLNSREGESWSYGTGRLVRGIDLTPDGRFVAAGSVDRCLYLSTGEGEHLWKYPVGDAVSSTALTNEADRIFAAAGKTIHVIDRTGAEVQKIGLGGRAESVAVTPEGSFLVVGGGEGDRSIRLFTNDPDLVEAWNPPEAVINETEQPGEATAGVTVSPAPGNTSTDTGAEVGAAAREEVPITSRVSGWVENIISLLFKPQEDFLA